MTAASHMIPNKEVPEIHKVLVAARNVPKLICTKATRIKQLWFRCCYLAVRSLRPGSNPHRSRAHYRFQRRALSSSSASLSDCSTKREQAVSWLSAALTCEWCAKVQSGGLTGATRLVTHTRVRPPAIALPHLPFASACWSAFGG